MMKELINEGKEFIKTASAICDECDQLTHVMGIRQCQDCCCFISFKIIAGLLIKSKCPLNKWH
jgi:hypothetical protein